MAGYLRQLAETALHSAPRLHSTAALPYSRAPEALAEEGWAGGHAELKAKDLLLESSPKRQNRVVPSFGAAAKEIGTRSEKKRAVATKKKGRPARATKMQPPRDNPAQPMLPRELPATKPQLTVSSVTTKPEQPTAAIVASPAVRELTPLPPKPPIRRPTVVSTRTLRAASRAKSTMPNRKSVATSAPDVHIHIGRIELTAAPLASAPKRESAPAKKPMSLDEYLQQRRKAAS